VQAVSNRVTSRRLFLYSGLLLIILIFFIKSSNRAAAASSYSITMTPSSTEIAAPPGGSTSSSFSVINEGSTGYTMTLSVAPYRVVGDNYNPEFTTLPGTTDASKWIHLNANSQYLKTQQLQNISYSLNVPTGTAPGGYYAVIFAETEPPASTGVTAHNRVGDILYITVNGPVVQQGSLQSTKLPHIVFGNSLTPGLIVRDTGGLHFLSTVNLTATGLFGRTAFEANLQRYVLPQTQRLVSASWNHLPIFGVYKVNRTATVAGQLQTLPSQWVVIIRPWLPIGISLVVLAVIVLILLQHKRHQAKSHKDQRL
jgi:hypothetical protein